MTTNYGTLSISELIIYNNNITSGSITYINKKISMNTGLDINEYLNISNGIIFGDNTIQTTASDVTQTKT